MSDRLLGKVAIVTGGASGFGEAIAVLFAREGACVAVADLNFRGATCVAESIVRGGGRAIPIHVDVALGPSVAAMVAQTLASFNQLDLYVNNAGIAQPNRPAGEVSEEEFDRLIAVNTKSLYWCAVKAVPHMRHRGGVIISSASALALRPRPNMAWYCASKAALVASTKALALELAPAKVRVCCLCPTAAETPLLADMLAVSGTAEEQIRIKDGFVASIPMGRMCEPADVANAALFLASDDASFITGVSLEVDGGRCI
jgi:3-oxoacyl-[acyl-carrier protein] reductase